MSHHVVTGAGPVGSTVALQLADQGERVVLVTRSGSGPEHPLIDRRRADVGRPGAPDGLLEDALAVHHCVHASRYDARTWRAELIPTERTLLEAAGRAGAVVVFPESLYAYGRVTGPITEDLPRAATTGKPGVRTELLRARAASSTPTVSVAASDFFGPRVLTSHAGERMLPTILAGRTLRVVGSLDQPHSFTYVPDLAAAMIRAAADPSLHGSFLHAPTAPALTQRALVAALAAAAGVPVPRLGTIPAGLLRAVGLVHRDTRELAELSYQFTAPFVLDSARSEERLGLRPTPFDAAVRETVAWWRARLSA
ncbi:NAD-dependent epimerase/dehydratase family protein [Nocardioides nitrophenolicus]|uniref:NAD-dependent epimerase/dehydratase family protein n=1 Tax=Nocardioides nitrophenolicus TaxID=60489 RepID=UPI00195ABE33|nr:NAD-dependent epimerase/dehydratase family protein [Nocardioides nitrophenolicus]MBM7519236.1 nucleoside-diphosphate-sugar epimerase [Nocardioides nitrophenolicus]